MLLTVNNQCWWVWLHSRLAPALDDQRDQNDARCLREQHVAAAAVLTWPLHHLTAILLRCAAIRNTLLLPFAVGVSTSTYKNVSFTCMEPPDEPPPGEVQGRLLIEAFMLLLDWQASPGTLDCATSLQGLSAVGRWLSSRVHANLSIHLPKFAF